MFEENTNKWEQWLESEEGRKALYPDILKPGNEKYLRNRLWWAFHAGNQPINGRLEQRADSLLKRVVEGGSYIGKHLKREIEIYLESKK